MSPSGGKREGAGRKPRGDKPSTVHINVHLTEKEARGVRKALAVPAKGVTLSAAVRDYLLTLIGKA